MRQKNCTDSTWYLRFARLPSLWCWDYWTLSTLFITIKWFKTCQSSKYSCWTFPTSSETRYIRLSVDPAGHCHQMGLCIQTGKRRLLFDPPGSRSAPERTLRREVRRGLPPNCDRLDHSKGRSHCGSSELTFWWRWLFQVRQASTERGVDLANLTVQYDGDQSKVSRKSTFNLV